MKYKTLFKNTLKALKKNKKKQDTKITKQDLSKSMKK